MLNTRTFWAFPYMHVVHAITLLPSYEDFHFACDDNFFANICRGFDDDVKMGWTSFDFGHLFQIRRSASFF